MTPSWPHVRHVRGRHRFITSLSLALQRCLPCSLSWLSFLSGSDSNIAYRYTKHADTTHKNNFVFLALLTSSCPFPLLRLMSRIHSAPNASVHSLPLLHFPRPLAMSTHQAHAPRPSLPIPNVIPNSPMNISAAIAKFRLTPKEVINAIAPHVFDERRRRRSPRRRGHSPSPQRPLSASHMHMNYMQRKGRKMSSPLRISGVFELDSDGESIVFYGKFSRSLSTPNRISF